MKCLYYLVPTLNSTHTISDDLHAIGVKDWYMHVISKDEAGLKKEHIHSSNYMETLDFVRTGLIGATIGLIVGGVGAVLAMVVQPLGPGLSGFAYLAIIVFATLFGAWAGGLYGIGAENQRLNAFHNDIEAGEYLFLIYARKSKIEAVDRMMREKHPESRHVATDVHFINPLRTVTRNHHTLS